MDDTGLRMDDILMNGGQWIALFFQKLHLVAPNYKHKEKNLI